MAVTNGIANLGEPSIAATEVLLPDRQDVIARCELEGLDKNGFAYNEKIWIKYNNATEAEVAAQEFAYKHADQRIFRVPKIYDWFSKGSMTYIIMEKVNGITYREYRKQHPDDEAGVFDAIIKAIRHLWTFPVPVQGPIGPFRKGIPNDRFFSDRGAGRTFERAADLEEWCNAKLMERERPERVDFASEPLVFCHLDLYSLNIIVCEDNTFYIIDWGMSGVYPLVFEDYGLLHQGRNSFASQLRSTLFSYTTPNLRAVARVGRINQGG